MAKIPNLSRSNLGGPTQVTTTPVAVAGPKATGTTFGGKPCYTPGPNYFTLGMGVAPSMGTCTMLEDDVKALGAKNSTFELTIGNGPTRITIKDLYIRQVEHQSPVHAGVAIVEVTFEDKRSLWQYADITGIYNRLREDGIAYWEPSTNSGTAWTFDEILQKLLDELDAGITASTGISWIPTDIVWRVDKAAAMLKALLGKVAWDIALKPDGTFELIDLSKTGSYKPPGNATITAHTKEIGDRAHAAPKTVRLAVPIYREERTAEWEAVLQHDVGDGTKKPGEWDTIANVLATWGSITEGGVRSRFYKKGDESKLWSYFGGGKRGRDRLVYIRGALYRFWRFSDSDRLKKLPLVQMKASTATTENRESAIGPQVVLGKTHQQGRKLDLTFFRNIDISGTDVRRLSWPVRIVDGNEGVVEFKWKRPLTTVSQVGGLAIVGITWQLDAPKPPTIEVGYYRKYEDTPLDAYYTRTKDIEGPNNGETLTRFDDKMVLREVSTDGGGSFSKQNETELDTELDNRLDAWKARFKTPDPEQVRIEGVSQTDVLTAQVRAITWRWESGVETAYRINSDRSPDRYGLGISQRVREARFVQAIVGDAPWYSDDIGGGGSSKHNAGPLAQTPAEMRDFQWGREVTEAYQEDEASLLIPPYAGVLVAEDWRPGKSGKRPCKAPGQPQTTRSGKGQITKPAGAGKVQITNGGTTPVG